VRALIAACATLAYGKFAYRSDRLEPMPSLKDGYVLNDLNAWTTYLFFSERNLRRALSAYATYYNRGDCTARLDRELHAVRRCLCLRKEAERSLRDLYSAGGTTFMGLPSHISVFCAL
jgi:hypothetical protein